jgi:hypothetical protein
VTEDIVYVVCPKGHKTGTQKPSGKIVRCQRCFHELDKTVMVMVPPRPAEPPKRLDMDWGRAECRTCRATAPRPGEKLLPVGWMTIMVGTNPAGRQVRRTRVYIGPYCSRECLVTGLPDHRRDDGVNPSHLMTMKPSGSDK